MKNLKSFCLIASIFLSSILFSQSVYAADPAPIIKECGIENNGVNPFDFSICQEDIAFRTLYEFFPDIWEESVFYFYEFDYLKDLKDSNGRFQYPEMKDGFLKGLPFDTTTNIPADLGTEQNESEIYLVDFNDVLIGETDTWSIDISTQTAYKDSNGDLQLTFQQNMSLLRLVTENDIGFRHLEGLIVGTGVKFNSTHYL